MQYELDDLDRALMAKLREEGCAEAIEHNDPPIKDYLDEDDIMDALRLLLKVVPK